MLKAGSKHAWTSQSWAQNDLSKIARIACASAWLICLGACGAPAQSTTNTAAPPATVRPQAKCSPGLRCAP